MADERSASDQLKARLTGAVALLIIGVVAWFWLLDTDAPVQSVVQESAIPPAPNIQPFAVPPAQAPAGVAPVGPEAEATAEPASPAPAASQPAAKPAPAAAAPAPQPAVAAKSGFQLDADNVPVAWVVQVAALSNRESADKLREKLIKKGYKAFTKASRTDSGQQIYKIYVGPKLSRARAEAQQHTLNADLKLKTIVVRFPAP